MSITHKLHQLSIHALENESFAYLIKCQCGWESRCNKHSDAVQAEIDHLASQALLRQSGGMRQGGI
jgi:hypothetical protein